MDRRLIKVKKRNTCSSVRQPCLPEYYSMRQLLVLRRERPNQVATSTMHCTAAPTWTHGSPQRADQPAWLRRQLTTGIGTYLFRGSGETILVLAPIMTYMIDDKFANQPSAHNLPIWASWQVPKLLHRPAQQALRIYANRISYFTYALERPNQTKPPPPQQQKRKLFAALYRPCHRPW